MLEAMKMEHQLVSDVDGLVAEVAVAAGAQVRIRQLIVSVTPEPAATDADQ
ncbi:MAG: biotin/lipoyl-containing protein [Paracoccaceae bacterium]